MVVAGVMRIRYGFTMLILALFKGRVRNKRLQYAAWLLLGQHTSMALRAVSGTLNYWFHDQLCRSLAVGHKMSTHRTLFLGRADRPPPPQSTRSLSNA